MAITPSTYQLTLVATRADGVTNSTTVSVVIGDGSGPVTVPLGLVIPQTSLPNISSKTFKELLLGIAEATTEVFSTSIGVPLSEVFLNVRETSTTVTIPSGLTIEEGSVNAGTAQATSTVFGPTMYSIVELNVQPVEATAEALGSSAGVYYVYPEIISLSHSVPLASILFGLDLLLLAGNTISVEVYNQAVTDPDDLRAFFHTNEGMIKYFRRYTGTGSYQFNDIAKEYYKAASGSDARSFNELNKAAQDADSFVGLAPTDWRNS